MDKTHKAIFIRHAESEFNLAQKNAANSEHEPSLENENLTVKFDHSYLDCGLSEKGIQQCQERKIEYIEMKIDYVFVSPLKRAVQTAYHLFKDHPSNPKFIALPEMREMLLSSCDVSGKILETMDHHQYIDFSRLTEKIPEENLNLWSLEHCEDKDQAQKALEYVKKRLEETGGDYQTDGPKFIIEYQKQIHPTYLETFQHTKERIERLKKVLKEELSKLPENSTVVCVTHSRTLHTFSSTEFDEQGEAINGIWWQNCDGFLLEF